MIEKCGVCKFKCKSNDIMVVYCCEKYKISASHKKKKVKRAKKFHLVI